MMDPTLEDAPPSSRRLEGRSPAKVQSDDHETDWASITAVAMTVALLGAVAFCLVRPDLVDGLPFLGLMYPALTGTLPPGVWSRWPTLSSAVSFLGPEESSHDDTWAVIVQSSRYWFNYRHAANALMVYHELKRRGIPDSHIIFMAGSDHACDPRNSRPCSVLDRRLSDKAARNLFSGAEIDFFGPEVTPRAFVDLMIGRGTPDAPPGQRMLSGPNSNIIVYMTGHSHADLMKFQDKDIVTSADMLGAIEEMERQGRYREMLVITDTCQAATLMRLVSNRAVSDLSSSKRAENSYSYNLDRQLGQSMADQMSHTLGELLRSPAFTSSEASLGDLVRGLKAHEGTKIRSTVTLRQNAGSTPADSFPLHEALGWPGEVDFVAL